MPEIKTSDRQKNIGHRKNACRFLSVLKALINALYPPICIRCRVLLNENHQKNEPITGFAMYMGSYLCPDCSNKYIPIKPPLCSVCGMSFKSKEVIDHICDDCTLNPKKYYKARACGQYLEPFKDIIHQFKYRKKIWLAKPLGQLLLKTYENFWNNKEVDMIIPVPLHIKRFRQRGYNQAYLIAKGICSQSRIDIPIKRDILKRIRWTEPQTNLGRKDRLKNLKNAFAIEHLKEIQDKKILIVDDVYTTGATINECAKALIKGGAKAVSAITLAKTM